MSAARSATKLCDGSRYTLTTGESRVRLLSTSIPDQVRRPAEEELEGQADGGGDRGVVESLPEFSLDLVRHLRAFQILLLGVEGGKTELLASLGNEDLVAGKVGRLSVVFAVLGVVQNQQVILC